MSADYPNRADWLEVRHTPRHRPGKLVFQSVHSVRVPVIVAGKPVMNPDGTPAYNLRYHGVTYNGSKKGPARKRRRLKKFARRYGVAA